MIQIPYQSIEAAKDAGFPTSADGAPLTLGQINKLAEMYDAIKAARTAKNPMAVAWTQWKQIYIKKGDEWVIRKTESALAEESEKFMFDVVMRNNKGAKIKIKSTYVYVHPEDQSTDGQITENNINRHLAGEMGYEGFGSYEIYEHDPELKVGDEIPSNRTPIYIITIAVSAKSSIFTSAISDSSNWIPVAAPNQQTTLSLKSGNVTLTISEEALKSNLETWKDGYVNVNHEDGGEIESFKILDAKFENGLLYHKFTPEVAEFIRNIASSGRSIEIQPLRIENNKVLEFNGLGVSVLYPPHKPACTHEMGCSSHIEETKTMGNSAIKEVFTKLADKLKSQSFMNSMFEEQTGIESDQDPNLEENMTEEIDKLTSARVLAEKSRDEAMKEVETLKSSLSEMDKTIKAKDELLKSYQEAEAAAVLKLKDDQWEILKSNIPAGKIHKPEDAEALKQEFINDPAGFAVKMASWSRPGATKESGAAYVSTGGDAYLKDRAEFSSGIGGL